ncbi:hypothetical protein MMC30_004983 [Trapelia coarctata]|nr:hypothetical protein [Trapelia coarctata]
MPHKHKRVKTSDKNIYELPPTTLAKPLPVGKPAKNATVRSSAISNPSIKRKRSHKDAAKDDTPRAFSRLMAFTTRGIKPPSGLDDGVVKSKKRKRIPTVVEPAAKATAPPPTDSNALHIKPGERYQDFSTRVDAALPVSGLIGRGAKGVKDLPGVKKQRTKTEKKMHRIYAEWREVEAKRKEALEEAKEEAEDQDPEFNGTSVPTKKSKKGIKGKGADSSDEDPWAAVGRNRQAGGSSGGLVGLHDVVQAPPQLKAPKAKFRVLDGAKVDVLDVPSKAGSLRRREELGEARRSVVEGYRAMMRERKGVGGS